MLCKARSKNSTYPLYLLLGIEHVLSSLLICCCFLSPNRANANALDCLPVLVQLAPVYIGNLHQTTDTHTIYNIGHGVAGGNLVQRFISLAEPHRTEIRKTYVLKERLRNDLRGLRIIDAAIHKRSGESPFRCVDVGVLDENTVRLTDVHGQDLARFKKSLPEEAKTPFEELWVAHLRVLDRQILNYLGENQAQYRIIHHELSRNVHDSGTYFMLRFRVYDLTSHEEVEILIKQDNVVINNLGEWWIVDPY